jgi:hypothetical protein
MPFKVLTAEMSHETNSFSLRKRMNRHLETVMF